MLALDLSEDAAAIGLAHGNQHRHRVERGIDIRDLICDQGDPVVLPVGGQGHAEAVDDATSRRRQQPQIDALLICEGGVFVRLMDLQIIESARKCREQQALTTGDQYRTPRQEFEPPVILLLHLRLA